MFPLKDSKKTNIIPFINYGLIFFTIFIFFLQLISGDFEDFVFRYGFIPNKFNFFNLESYKNVIFSIFLHGGFFHILSNMWFLHIFGDNVEEKLGHFKYLIFYILGGVFAVFSQYIFNPNSIIPMIGASGAVSAVAGVYFAFFKKSKIESLVFSFGFVTKVNFPAWFFLGYWFLIQVFSGAGSLLTFNQNQGGVAWFAHIGGFLFGYLLFKK